MPKTKSGRNPPVVAALYGGHASGAGQFIAGRDFFEKSIGTFSERMSAINVVQHIVSDRFQVAGAFLIGGDVEPP